MSDHTLSAQEIFIITEAMFRYGGNFYKHLSAAIRYADPENTAKVLGAFPDILTTYGPGTGFYNVAACSIPEETF